jgi:hypothetical protein
LIGRRAAKIFEGAQARAGDDTTPIPRVYQMTPATGQVIYDPSSLTAGGPTPLPAPVPIGRNTGPHPSQPSLLGRPTPLPSSQPKTPTSIQGSNGQLSMPVAPPRRRGVWIGVATIAVIAIGAVAIFGLGKSEATQTQPASAPPAAASVAPAPPPAPPPAVEPQPEPVAVEPATIEPAQPPPVVAEPSNPVVVKVTPVVKKPPAPKPIKKPPPPKTEPTPAEPGGDLYIKRQ